MKLPLFPFPATKMPGKDAGKPSRHLWCRERIGAVVLLIALLTSVSAQEWENIAGPIDPMHAVAIAGEECVLFGPDSAAVFDRYGTLRDVAPHAMGRVYHTCTLRDTVWAGSDRGLWFSADACRTWARSGDSANVVFVDIANDELLFTVRDSTTRVISSSSVWTLPQLRYDLIGERQIPLPDGRLAIRTDTGLVLLSPNSTELNKPIGRLADMEGIEEWGEQFVGWINDTLFFSVDLEEWMPLRSMPRVGPRMKVHINNDMLIADSRTFYRVSLRDLSKAFDSITTIDPHPFGFSTHRGVLVIIDQWQVAIIDEDRFLESRFGAIPGGRSNDNGGIVGNHWIRVDDTVIRFGQTNWRTVNRGRSWLPLNNISKAAHAYVAGCVVQQDSVVMLVDTALMRSSDLGATWSAVDVGERVMGITADRQKIIALTRSKVMVSGDGGMSFVPWIEQLPFVPQSAGDVSLSVRGDTLAVFYDGGRSKGMITTNAGADWTELQSTWQAQVSLWNGWCIVNAMDNSYATRDAGKTFMEIDEAPEPIRSWRSHTVSILDDGTLMRYTSYAVEAREYAVGRFNERSNVWENVAVVSFNPHDGYVAATESGDLVLWRDSSHTWVTYLLELTAPVVSVLSNDAFTGDRVQQRTVYSTSPVCLDRSECDMNTIRCFDVMGREVAFSVGQVGENVVVSVAGEGPYLITYRP